MGSKSHSERDARSRVSLTKSRRPAINDARLNRTIGPLAQPNKAIGFQVSNRTVVGKTAAVLSKSRRDLDPQLLERLPFMMNMCAKPSIVPRDQQGCHTSIGWMSRLKNHPSSLTGRSLSLTSAFIGRDFEGSVNCYSFIGRQHPTPQKGLGLINILMSEMS